MLSSENLIIFVKLVYYDSSKQNNTIKAKFKYLLTVPQQKIKRIRFETIIIIKLF